MAAAAAAAAGRHGSCDRAARWATVRQRELTHGTRTAAPRRQGKLLLELASSTGERSYGWDQKVSLAMSASELGQIFSDPGQVGAGGWARLGARGGLRDT
jgi:hypothetical protein